jgi:hypothetical protein
MMAPPRPPWGSKKKEKKIKIKIKIRINKITEAN